MQPRGPSEGLVDAGAESLNNGIDSNEIVVEGQPDDDGDKGSEDEDGELGEDDDEMDGQHAAQAVREGEEVGEPDDELVEDAEAQYLDRKQMEEQ